MHNDPGPFIAWLNTIQKASVNRISYLFKEHPSVSKPEPKTYLIQEH